MLELEPYRGRGGAACAGGDIEVMRRGGVAERVIGTACAAQDWWLARSEHFSVTELSCEDGAVELCKLIYILCK